MSAIYLALETIAERDELREQLQAAQAEIAKLREACLSVSRNLRHWRDDYDEFQPTVVELTDAIQRIDAARAGGGT